MKTRLEECEYVRVQFVSPITDSLLQDEVSNGWGFTITSQDGDKTAFVDIGSKLEFERLFDKMEESLPRIAIFGLMNSNDEIACELFDNMVNAEDGFMVNGEIVSHRQLESEMGALGEKEEERVKKRRQQIEMDVEESIEA
jgi:hypothetical protein